MPLRRAIVATLVVAWLSAAGQPAAAGADHPAALPEQRPPAQAELVRRLAEADFRIRVDAAAGGGVTGARRLTLLFPADGRELDVKWKAAPGRTADGWNNSPRKELAAYVVQQWFLEPEDYVVPTTVMRCVPVDALRGLEREVRPIVEGTRCVLGLLAVWLHDVTAPASVYEEERFKAEPAYARHMADLNLLAYLIKHQDGRRGNFLMSTDAADRRVFAVDNGIAFGTWLPNFLVLNWDKIRVPALRKVSVDRLRGLARRDIERLGVLAELHADASGILKPVAPGPNLKPSRGVRIGPGSVQLGLTDTEIDALWARVRGILEDVERGAVALF